MAVPGPQESTPTPDDDSLDGTDASDAASPDASPDEGTDASTDDPSAGATATTDAEADGNVVRYTPAIVLTEEADLAALADAPAGFTQFLGTMLTDLAQGECESSITIETRHLDGWASGIVDSCGSVLVVWADTGGQWLDVAGTQDTWSCDALSAASVPPTLFSPPTTCLTGAGAEVEYAG